MCWVIYHICIIQNPSSNCSQQQALCNLFIYFLNILRDSAHSASCQFYVLPRDELRQPLVNNFVSAFVEFQLGAN